MYSYKPNPIMETYALSAVFLYLISAWLCYSFINSTNPIQGQIISLHAGSVRAYLIGKIVMVSVLCCVLCLVAVIYPLATNMFNEPVTLKIGVLALAVHLESSLLGIAIPLFFNRTFIRSGSFAVSCILMILVITLAKGGIVEAFGLWLEYLLWILPPTFQLIDMLSNFEIYSTLEIIAALAIPIVYCFVFFWLYLKLQPKRM